MKYVGLVLALLWLPFAALSQSFTGLLASNYDTWNRMTMLPVSSGQNCFFEVTPFDVAVDTNYTFTVKTTNFPGSINLYVNKFFPLSPAVNFWDNGFVTNSPGTFVYTDHISPGSYEIIISSTNAGQTGTYGVTITGPAPVTVNPRPTTPSILQNPNSQTIL